MFKNNQMTTAKGIPFMILLITLDYVQVTSTKEASCFVLVFMDTAWTDRRPDFYVNMTFGDHGNIYSETRVTKEISSPITRMLMEQKDSKNQVSTLYNVTARLCDLHAMVSKIPMMKQAYQTITKHGNYTLECPMKPGFYVTGNMRIASRSPIFALMFRPRVRYTFKGAMYEELANKTMLPLTTYRFAFKVVKKPCKE